MATISEKDWKRLRKLKSQKLEKACEDILAEVEKTLKTRKGKEYEAYLAIWKLLKKEDEKISIMFDDQKRSNAILKISALRHNGYLSDEEMKEFSDRTQEIVEALNQT